MAVTESLQQIVFIVIRSHTFKLSILSLWGPCVLAVRHENPGEGLPMLL